MFMFLGSQTQTLDVSFPVKHKEGFWECFEHHLSFSSCGKKQLYYISVKVLNHCSLSDVLGTPGGLGLLLQTVPLKAVGGSCINLLKKGWLIFSGGLYVEQ